MADLKSTFLGIITGIFRTLSSVLSAVYMIQRDYLSELPAETCKVCKSLSIALIILFTSAGRAVPVDSQAFTPK